MLGTYYNEDIVKLLEQFNFKFNRVIGKRYIGITKGKAIYLVDQKRGISVISNKRFKRLIHKFISDRCKENKLHLTFEL